MRDTIFLGGCPASEHCSTFAHYETKQKELGAWMSQIRRAFGAEPAGARLVIKYLNCEPVLALVIEDDYTDAVRYARQVENRLPDYWDTQSRIELGLQSNGNGRH